MLHFYHPFPTNDISKDPMLAALTLALLEGNLEPREEKAKGLFYTNNPEWKRMMQGQLGWFLEKLQSGTASRPEDIKLVGREATITTTRALMSTMLGSAHQLEYPVCMEMLMDGMFLAAHFNASLIKFSLSADGVYRQCLIAYKAVSLMCHEVQGSARVQPCLPAWERYMETINSWKRECSNYRTYTRPSTLKGGSPSSNAEALLKRNKEASR